MAKQLKTYYKKAVLHAFIHICGIFLFIAPAFYFEKHVNSFNGLYFLLPFLPIVWLFSYGFYLKGHFKCPKCGRQLYGMSFWDNRPYWTEKHEKYKFHAIPKYCYNCGLDLKKQEYP